MGSTVETFATIAGPVGHRQGSKGVRTRQVAPNWWLGNIQTAP